MLGRVHHSFHTKGGQDDQIEDDHDDFYNARDDQVPGEVKLGEVSRALKQPIQGTRGATIPHLVFIVSISNIVIIDIIIIDIIV